MAIVSGRVKIRQSNLDTRINSPRVGDGGHPGSQSITVNRFHEMALIVDGHAIVLRQHVPIFIDDGDEVAFCGQVGKDGLFHADAYENLSQKVRSYGNPASWTPTGWAMIASSVLCASFFLFWLPDFLGPTLLDALEVVSRSGSLDGIAVLNIATGFFFLFAGCGFGAWMLRQGASYTTRLNDLRTFAAARGNTQRPL